MRLDGQLGVILCLDQEYQLSGTCLFGYVQLLSWIRAV